MSSEFVSLSGPFRFESPEGGNVQVAPEANIFALGQLPWPPEAIGLGPLTLGTRIDQTLWIDELTYEHGGSSSSTTTETAALPGLLLAGHQAGTAGDDETDGADVTRRDVLKVAGGLGAGLVFASQTASAGEVIDIARFNVGGAPTGLQANPGGIEVGILDVVADVLPVNTEFTVLADGARVTTFRPGDGETAIVPPKTTGEIRVASTNALGLLESLLASLTGLFGTRNTISYQFVLPDSAAKLSTDREIVLSSQPMVVNPLKDHAPDATSLTIGGESVPHIQEDGSGSLGVYFVREGEAEGTHEFVYRVGDAAPDAYAAEIQIDIGQFSEARDDINRRF